MNGRARNNRPTAASLKSTLVRIRFLLVLGVVLLSQTAVLGDVPGFRAPQLTTPTNPSYFSASTTPNSAAWSSVDDEIKELARGLKYDPGLMYKFVHDYIKFTPGWGDLKGPYMTWMDRSGNSFDQASLMIALLEEAEANPSSCAYTVSDAKYVVGKIELDKTEFEEWFSLINDSPAAARAALARAGIYAEVIEDGYGEIETVEMVHVWVRVTIDDADPCDFDPSFKKHDRDDSQVTLYGDYGTAMVYDLDDFLDAAEEGSDSGTNWIEDLNKSNIRDELDEYTDNLIDYIGTNLPNGGLTDLIGGLTIEPADETALPPTSPDYDVLSTYDDFDKAVMPDMYRTTLCIEHEGVDWTFNSSEIYGRRLSLQYSSNQPQILLDGSVKDTGTTTSAGTPYDLTLTVDHPYHVSDFDSSVTVTVTSGGFYNIVNGWGDTNTRIIEKHRSDLEQYRYDGESDSSEKVLGESFAIVGLTWLAQTSKMRALASGKQCERPLLINHHMIGVTGQYGSAYIDMPLGHLGLCSNSKPDETLATVSGHAAGYEHEVIRQLQDFDSVSAINLMEMANDESTYDKIYSADSTNWSTIQSNLQDYSQDELDLVYSYIDPTNGGFTVYLPENGNLNTGNWTGMGFIAKDTSGTSRARGYIISNGHGGGAATGSSDTMIPADLLDRGDVFAGEREGTYHQDATDMTIGTGGMPFGLSLSRTYSSQRRLKDGPLGLGWTHNFDVCAKVKSDSFQALGADSTIDAAAHIVALHVIHDILTRDGDTLANNVIVSLIESWLMDQMMDNLVNIEQGGSKTQFVRVPDDDSTDGFYNPPTRTALKLVLNSGNFRLKTPGGIFNDFDSAGLLDEWSDAHGNKVDFSYSTGNLSSVACKIGGTTSSWSLTFSYSGNRISSVTDSASRSISYTYDGDGNLIEYTDPDSKDTTYDYDSTNDGQLTKVFSPLSTVDPVLTNVYDSIGRLRQQKDADDNATDYYLAGFRAETMGPAQVPPGESSKRFSTVVWADEFGRPISATDQLGRESTHEYDGKLRLIKSTSAFGTSSEFQYNQYNRVSQKDSKVKPGSGDPEIAVSFDHDSNENQDGRWFIQGKTATDPNGFKVYHYYDYNEPSPPSTVGNLLKIAYPPNEDAVIATVEFTYNSYGQIETTEDPGGTIAKYEYNDAAYGSTLEKVTADYGTGSELNIATEYTYDSVGNVASVKDPLGNTTTYEYSDARLLEKTTAPSPLSYETTYEYYDDGKLAKVKQEEDGGGGGSGTVGNTTVYTSTTSPTLRESVSCTMSEDGTIQSIAIYHSGDTGDIMLGVYADNGSNKPGDLLGSTAATDANSTEGWQTVNLTSPLSVTNGQKIWLAWVSEDFIPVRYTLQDYGRVRSDDDGWAEGMADPWGTGYYGGRTYSIYANYTTSGGGGGGDTIVLQHVTYTDRGQKETVKGPYVDGSDLGINLTTFEYDDLGRLTKVTDAENNMTEMQYYPDNKVYRVIDAELQNTVTNTYDANGYLEKVEDAEGNATEYEYNGFGALKKTIYADGTFTQPVYSSIRESRSIQTRAGDVIQMWYDHLNRVKRKITYPEGQTWAESNIRYKYDIRGRVIETYETAGSSHTGHIKNTYDDVGRLTKVEYEDDREVLYEYDAAGNRTKLTYPDSSYITYEYDELNRLEKIKNSSGNALATYTYDSRSRRTDLDYFNGQSIEYTYDAASRLTSIDNGSGNGDFDYTSYDKVGNRLTMVANGDTHTYTYDDIYQIATVDYPDGHAFEDEDTTFNYDKAGNRTSVVEDGTNTFDYEANILNQYDSVGGIYYDYDLNGNTTYDGVSFYTYDTENRLISATNAEDSIGGPLNAALDNMDLTFTTGAGSGGSGTVGNTTVYTNTTSASYRYAIHCTMTEDGTIDSISIYHEGDTGNLMLGVYADNGSNKPGDLLGATASTAANSTEGWQTVDLTSSVEVDDGDKIWLAWVSEDRIPVRYTTQTNGRVRSAAGVWADGMEDPFDTSYYGNATNSIYANYTTSGGGAAWTQVRPDAEDPDIGGPDSVKSPVLDASESCSLKTTVYGKGTFKFYYKKDAGTDDTFRFKIDDSTKFYVNNSSQSWDPKTYTITDVGLHTFEWEYEKGTNGTTEDGGVWIDRVEWDPGNTNVPVLQTALDTTWPVATGGDSSWSPQYSDPIYYGSTSAQSGNIDEGEVSNMEATVEGSGNGSFYWKVSSASGDYLKFYLDGELEAEIDEDQDWVEVTFDTVTTGTHSLVWEFTRNDTDNDNCGWVDYLQWSGSAPPPDPDAWDQIDFEYDVYGRRSEKTVDADTTKYLYDGPQVLAEYDGNNNLLRKFVYGPGIDQPVCMIEEGDADSPYYYHYDALGSVVALSDEDGDNVQTYEYSVHGEVSATDEDHTNPYMFAGRRYDIEIGLYYNRARYYNPYTGRFLQADPIGYGDGMNMYAYCGSNPLNYTDPSGNREISIDIPLQTVWDHPSSDEYLKQNPGHSHMADVDAYLTAAGLYDTFLGVTLTSVDYSNGQYNCTFDVPDEIDFSMSIIYEWGVPLLNVTTSENGSTRLTDRRLDNMIGLAQDDVFMGGRGSRLIIAGVSGLGAMGPAKKYIPPAYGAAKHTVKTLRVLRGTQLQQTLMARNLAIANGTTPPPSRLARIAQYLMEGAESTTDVWKDLGKLPGVIMMVPAMFLEQLAPYDPYAHSPAVPQG